ncbi:flavoprotein [Saccharothrix sp. BKS2]|uniref:flavoprotein n=1 Tax=Saccharothrix sp. BKS2 TaxID=3064400 RepID=UPI0039EB0209
MSCPEKLLLGVSGSVAALTLPNYLYAFRAAGVRQIIAVVTVSASAFISAQALGVICDRVYTDADPARSHVALGRWADHTLVLPATAHLLGCLAHGLAPSRLTTALLAVDGPITLVPAMNPVMWGKPAVQRNVAVLRGDGHRVVEPIAGASYEVASRAIVPGLVPPPPEDVVRCVSGVEAIA